MKKYTFILILIISLYSCKEQGIDNKITLIEEKLDLEIPSDLKTLWSDSTFQNSQREFYFRNFGKLFFLTPDELNKYTLEREVNGAMNESNNLFYLQEEGKISEEDKSKLVDSFYKDIVMMSKNHKKEKALVFATSTWREEFVDIYYNFDSNNRNLGIYLSNNDQGSLVPIFLGEDLSDVFGNLTFVKKGFEDNAKLSNFMYKYSNDELIKNNDFPYGIFPQRDLREIVITIVPDIYIVENKPYDTLADSVKNKIIDIYKLQGKIIDFNEEKLEYYVSSEIGSYLKGKNNEDFNDNQEYRIFIVEFPFLRYIGIARCTPDQARKLNELGVLRYDWMDRTEKEFKFMNY